MHKKYKTRQGNDVEILRIDVKHDVYTVLGIVTEEDGRQYANAYTRTGQQVEGRTFDSDLVEVNPYADWKIDDKVEYSFEGTCWSCGHFAGTTEDGTPLIWQDGRSSFTAYAVQGKVPAKFIRLY